MMSAGDARVYEKYADELVRFATVLVGPNGAEDLVAETMLRVLTSPSWPSVVDHRPYLFRSVLHRARSDHRSTQRRHNREARSGADQTVAHEHVRAEVIVAMRRLTVRQRAVVYFVYWEDVPVEEIASALAVSRRTVQRELATAQRRLEVLLT